MSESDLSLDVVRVILSREYADISADPAAKPKAVLHVYNKLVESGQQEIADLLMYFHAMTGAVQPPMSDRPNITYNISSSTIGSATFSSQVGSITTSMNSVALQPGGMDFAGALKALTDAVLSATDLQEMQKKEAMDALEFIGKEAEETPEKRRLGILRPVVESIPKVLSSASAAITAWHTVGPHVLKFFGF